MGKVQAAVAQTTIQDQVAGIIKKSLEQLAFDEKFAALQKQSQI